MKKLFIIILLFFLSGFLIFAQKKELKKGNKAFAKKQYAKALHYFNTASSKGAKLSPSDLQNIANCNYYQRNFGEAKEYFDQISKDDMRKEALGNYAKLLQHYGFYGKALMFFDAAMEKGSTDPVVKIGKESCKWAQENSTSSGYELTKADVITDGRSFGISFFQDGIIYSAESKKGGIDRYGNPFTDMFYVEYDNAVIGTPKLLSENFAAQGHEGSSVVYEDGNAIIYTQITEGKKGTHMKLMTAKLEGNEWGKPKPLSFNSKKYSCAYPSISFDGETLYFASDMPGGYGGFDLYYAKRNGDSWGNPVNLGEDINTEGDEIYPFAERSNGILFSSNGHLGFGGQDIFFATGSKTEWTEVVNMKKPINSSKNDFAYFDDPLEAERAYMTSNREGTGENEIIYVVKALTTPQLSSEDILNEDTWAKKEEDSSSDFDSFLSDDDAADEDSDGNTTNESSELDDFSESDTSDDSFDSTESESDSEEMTMEEQLRAMMGEDAVVYRVQFMSSRKAKNKVKLDETGDFVYRYFYEGLYRYTVGEFYDPEPAIDLKKRLQEFGYTDAFVATFRKGERVLDVQVYKRTE